MSCDCHGDSKKSTLNVKPYDQCLMCARKHVNSAWNAWHEFGHELDNRDFCSAELRASASHCKYLQPELAKECRDIAKAIEMFEDGNLAERIDTVRKGIANAFLEDNKDLLDKLISFKELQ